MVNYLGRISRTHSIQQGSDRRIQALRSFYLDETSASFTEMETKDTKALIIKDMASDVEEYLG